MASTINSSTSNGIVITPDTSGEIELQANGVTKAKVTANGLQDANGASLRGGSFRNLIINGDMRIAQRGTSFTGITSGVNFPVDRWVFEEGTDGTFTIEQSTDVPSGQGFQYSLKTTSTTSATLSTTSFISINQWIEGNNIAHLEFGTANAKTVTVSFWVKASVTGTYTSTIYANSANIINPQGFTINTADTWEKKTITFDGATSGTWLTTNGRGLNVVIYPHIGTNYQGASGWNTSGIYGVTGSTNAYSSNGNTFLVTGVQLEVGSGASDFEFLPYDVQLARCQRYYCKSYNTTTAPATNTSNGINIWGGSTQASGYQYMCLVFPQDMRTTPSITFYRDNGADNTWEWRRSGASGTVAPVAPYGSMRQMQMYVNAGGSYAVSLVWGHWVASAEL